MLDPIEALRNDIADGHVMALIGTGVSIQATNRAPAASWIGLLDLGIEFCKKWAKPKPHSSWITDQRRKLKQPRLENLLAVATNLEQILHSAGEGLYARFLQHTIGQLTAEYKDTLYAIRALEKHGVQLATTNYDTLLEEVTGYNAVSWNNNRKFFDTLKRKIPAILHLHGHWDDPSSMVLGRYSYDRVATSSPAQVAQQFLAYSKTLLFIGFGDGLRDPNFTSLFDWQRQSLPPTAYPHFRLCRSNEEKALREQYVPDPHVTIIAYGGEYKDLPTFLASLTTPIAITTTARGEHTAALFHIFQDERDRKLQDFTGREWLFDVVEEWLDDPTRETVLLIQGGAGVGKTAFAAKLLENRQHSRKAVVYHFCMASHEVTLSPTHFCRSMQEQLPISLGASETSRSSEASDPSSAFYDTIEAPLSRLARHAGVPAVFVVIDGLDEAVEYGFRPNRPVTIIDLLKSLLRIPGIRLLATTRPDLHEEDLVTALGRPRVHRIRLDDPAYTARNRADVLKYSRLRLFHSKKIQKAVAETFRGVTPEQFLEEVVAASVDNFQYVVLLFNDIEATGEILSLPIGPDGALAGKDAGPYVRPHVLPQGLESIYLSYLQSRRLGRDWHGRNRAFVGTLAASRTPLSREQIRAYSEDFNRRASIDDVDAFLDEAAQFLTVLDDNGGCIYKLYHLSFGDFFFKVASRFQIDERYVHARMGKYAAEVVLRSRVSDTPYAYNDEYVLYHLIRGCQWDLLVEVVSDAAFFDRHISAVMRRSFFSDLFEAYRLLSLSATEDNDKHARRLIAAIGANVLRHEAAGDDELYYLLDLFFRRTTDAPMAAAVNDWIAATGSKSSNISA